MKVLSIQAIRRRSDQKIYYRCWFEGCEKPLITWETPQFKEGEDLSQDKLVLSEDGQTWLLKGDSRADTTERDSSIREQTAIKAIVEIFSAGKIQEFEESTDSLVVNAREWITAALVHGPLMSTLLPGNIHPLGEE
jgi:hypothetical protein